MKLTRYLFTIILFLFYHAIVLASSLTTSRITSDVYVISADDYGTNIGVIRTHKGLLLIDPMPGEKNLTRLNAEITNLFREPVKHIVNTHQHSDHTGGNAFFEQGGSVVLNTIESQEYVKTFEFESHSNNDKVFLHTPSNTIFVGDIYDTSWHPTFYAGGLVGFNTAIDAILRLADDKSIIVPGHGLPSDKSALKRFQINTIKWVNKIQELTEKGLTFEQIKANDEVQSLLQNFNSQGKQNFLPEKAINRFIERSIQLTKESA